MRRSPGCAGWLACRGRRRASSAARRKHLREARWRAAFRGSHRDRGAAAVARQRVAAQRAREAAGARPIRSGSWSRNTTRDDTARGRRAWFRADAFVSDNAHETPAARKSLAGVLGAGVETLARRAREAGVALSWQGERARAA